MDRESRDTFELLDEIEKTLALDTAPMTWPVGRGRDFLGTYDLATGECVFSKAAAPRPERRSRSILPNWPGATPISTSPKSRKNSRWFRKRASPLSSTHFVRAI